MPPTIRELIAIVAALVSGGAAVFVLTDSRTANWVGYATAGSSDGWWTDSSTGAALGAVAAVCACSLGALRGSRRSGWGAVALSGVIVVALTLLARTIDSVGVFETAHVVRCLAAGAMLGAAVAACWGRIPLQAAVTAGALTAVVCSPVRSQNFGWTAYSPLTSHDPSFVRLGDPNWWLLGGAVVLAVAATATTQSRFLMQRSDRRTVKIAIGGAVVFVITNRLLAEWIVRDAFHVYRSRVWLAVFISAAIVLAVGLVVARLAGPGAGTFVLVGLGITATVVMIVRDVKVTPPTFPTQSLVLTAVVAAIVGLRVSRIRPNALLGLGVLALVPVLSVIWPVFANTGFGMTVRIAVVTAAAGYALGSAYPGASPFAAFGLAVVFSSTALTAAASVPETRRVEYAFLGDGPLMRIDALGDPGEYRVSALAMLLVIAVCAVGVVALRRGTADAAIRA